MRGPITLAVAVAVAGLIGYLLSTTMGIWQIKMSWTIITIGVVLDITQMERALVKAALRAFGTLLGAVIGMGIVAIYTGLKTGSTLTADLWIWFAVAGVAFLLALLMQYAGDNSYIYHLTSITVVIVAYSGDILIAVGRFISVLAGTVIAMASLLLFSHEPTHKRVSRYYELAVRSCLTLVQVALTEQGIGGSDVIPTVREALFNAQDALEARQKWRDWFRLSDESEMHALSESVINLYHECHSCAITANIVDLPGLMREEDFALHFEPLLQRFATLISNLQVELHIMHDISQPNTTAFAETIEKLAELITALNAVYQDHLESSIIGLRVNSIIVVLAVTVISLAQYCIDACNIPTVVPMHASLLGDMTCRLELVQSELRMFLKSGPAVLHFKSIAQS